MWRVNHFDVSADHPERAMKFYSEVFGWKFEKWNGPFDYWMIMTGDPKNQALMEALPSAKVLTLIS